MTNEQFADAVRRAGARRPKELLTQRHMDLAASIQAVTEEVMLRLARSLARETRPATISALPAASRSTASPTASCCATALSTNIWVQPAAGDAGGALGAALAAYHHSLGAARARSTARRSDARAPISGRLSRRTISSAGWPRRAHASRSHRTRMSSSRRRRARRRRRRSGWFQGRMEFGPRALGARSILGDPRSPTMQKTLNLQGQISRELPPVRAVGAARGRRRLVRTRRRLALHAAGRRRETGTPSTR